MHDLRDLGGRIRRLLVSVAIGVAGVILIVFALDTLIHNRDHGPNGFDVWMMLVGMVALTITAFALLEKVAHRTRVPRAIARRRQ